MYKLFVLLLLSGLSFVSFAAIEPERSSSYYEEALEYFSTDSYSEAIIELRNALQQDPANLSARILLGRALLKHDKPNAAIVELDRALQEGGDENLILPSLAKAYMATLAPEKVIAQIKPEGHQTHVDAELWVLRGNAFMLYQKLEQAREAYQHSDRLISGNTPARLGLVRVHLAKREFQPAMDSLEQILRDDPVSEQALVLKALLLRDMGNRAEALKTLQELLEMAPHHIKALGVRAGIWMDQGEYQKAENDLTVLREQSPSDLEGIYLSTLLYFRDGRGDEAEKLLSDTSEILLTLNDSQRSKLPQSQLMLGIIAYFNNDYQRAISFLTKFLKRLKGHSGATRYLVAAYLKNGEPKEVITLLRPAIGEEYPEDPTLLSMLAEAYRSNGVHSKAIELYQKALKLAPGQAGIGLRLAVSRFETSDKLTALADLESLYQQVPDLQEAGMQLTRMYATLGRQQEALKTIQGLSARYPDDPTVITLHAVTAIAAQQEDLATGLFNQAIELDPEFMLPRIGLARLSVHQGQIDRAVSQFEDILQVAPSNITSLVELANIFVKQRKLEEADELLVRVFAIEPRHIEAHLLYLRSIYYQGRRDKLDVRLSKVQNLFPDEPRVLLELASIHATIGQTDLARILLRRLVTNVGFKPDVLRQAAIQQISIGADDDALWALTKSLQADPANLDTLATTVSLHLKMGNLQKAEEVLKLLHTKHPDALMTILATGEFHMVNNQPEQAESFYLQAYEMHPSSQLAQSLFKASLAAGHNDLAIKRMQGWLEQQPRDFTSRVMLASVFMIEKREDEAQLIFEGLFAENPDDPFVLNNLALLYYQKGDDRALSFAEQAYNKLPKHPSILDTYGWILVQSGEAKRGLVLLRDAYSRQSTNFDIRYHIAEALVKLKRYREAKIELTGILKSRAVSKFNSRQQAQDLFDRIKAL